MDKQNFEQEFMFYYNLGFSTKDICFKIGCSPNKGYKFLKKKGLPSHSRLPVVINQKDIQKITEFYISGKTIQQIAKEMGVKEGTVNYWLRKKGITRPNGKIPNCNQSYFENIDTPQKAYFLGLLYADGSILIGKTKNRKNKYTIRLELKSQDKYILEIFRKEIGSSLPIKNDKRESDWEVNGKVYHIQKNNSYFEVSCKKMGEDLISWGCVPQKTGKLKGIPSKLDSNLIKYFLLGFYDGDGIASIGKKSHYMGFCGDLEMLQSIDDYIHQEIKIKKHTLYYNKFNGIYYLEYTSLEEIEKLYNFFYDNISVSFLTRKQEKIYNFLKVNTEIT